LDEVVQVGGGLLEEGQEAVAGALDAVQVQDDGGVGRHLGQGGAVGRHGRGGGGRRRQQQPRQDGAQGGARETQHGADLRKGNAVGGGGGTAAVGDPGLAVVGVQVAEAGGGVGRQGRLIRPQAVEVAQQDQVVVAELVLHSREAAHQGPGLLQALSARDLLAA